MQLSKNKENNTDYCWVDRCHFCWRRESYKCSRKKPQRPSKMSYSSCRKCNSWWWGGSTFIDIFQRKGLKATNSGSSARDVMVSLNVQTSFLTCLHSLLELKLQTRTVAMVTEYLVWEDGWQLQNLGDKRKQNRFGTLGNLFSTPLRIAWCFSCTTQHTALIKWNKIMKENVLWANLHAKSTFSGKRCNFSEVRRAAPSYITGIFDELAFPFCLIKQMD